MLSSLLLEPYLGNLGWAITWIFNCYRESSYLALVYSERGRYVLAGVLLGTRQPCTGLGAKLVGLHCQGALRNWYLPCGECWKGHTSVFEVLRIDWSTWFSMHTVSYDDGSLLEQAVWNCSRQKPQCCGSVDCTSSGPYGSRFWCQC